MSVQGTRPFKAIAFLLLLGGACPIVLAASQQKMARRPMAEQAKAAAQRPMKIEVKPVKAVVKAGEKVGCEVLLYNADNQPTGAAHDTSIVVQWTVPSGKTSEQRLDFKQGESSKTLEFSPNETGVISVRGWEANNELLPGGNSVYVSPAKSKKPSASNHSELRQSPSGASDFLTPVYAHRSASFPEMRAGQYSEVAWRPSDALPERLAASSQSPGGDSSAVSSDAELVLSISSGRNEFLADGKDYARIVAFYVGPDGRGAPFDIQIWMQWDHGIVDPQPLTIHKGDQSGEAHMTSESPATATMTVMTSVPKLPIAPPTTFTVTFDAPIYGFHPVYPATMSLVDAEDIMAEYFDQNGNPIQSTKSTSFTFIPKDSILQVQPDSVDVPAGSSGAIAKAFPASMGSSQLTISTPDYPPQTITIQVTGWLVLIMCLAGGAIGGVGAFGALKGSLFWRVFTGILGGVVFCWAYVFGALPRISTGIAHNIISVPIVALIGGYLGIQAIDFVVDRFKVTS